MHKSLKSLLSKYGLKSDQPPLISRWEQFLIALSNIYQQSDADRYFLGSNLLEKNILEAI